MRAAWVAGLDPMVGFLHSPKHGRPSLACDLVELSRPSIDGWVYRLFAERDLRDDHFSKADEACLIGKAARALIYERYEDVAVPERRRLRHLAGGLAAQARAAAR